MLIKARHSGLLFSLVSLVLIVIAARVFNERPGYTDAFYHYNAAVRLVEGYGLTDTYLWTYLGAPDMLPAPSHIYWMPLTTLVAALGMSIFGISYTAAQVGLIILTWGAAQLTWVLGLHLSGGLRQAWLAGLLFVTGGFFLRMWGATDTFAPYAFIGATALLAMGKAVHTAKGAAFWWILAGVMSGLGHLTRSDGLLFLIVGFIVMYWPTDWLGIPRVLKRRTIWLGLFLGAYLLVMAPWLARNLTAMGAVLPVGGTQTIWYTSYDEMFNYPPLASLEQFLDAGGISLLWSTRIEGLSAAFQNLLAVEGYIILFPFMMWGLWKRRYLPLLRPMIWFAIGVHTAFALVFTFPGIRGGLFHAVVALMPFWCVLGVLGLDDIIDAAARRIKHWNPPVAKRTFGLLLLVVVTAFSLAVSLPNRLQVDAVPALYQVLESQLPEDARVMSGDPAQLFYFTRRGGVTLPNSPVDLIPAIAARYDVDYLVVQYLVDEGTTVPVVPQLLMFDLDTPPKFLNPIELNVNGARLYAIHR